MPQVKTTIRPQWRPTGPVTAALIALLNEQPELMNQLRNVAIAKARAGDTGFAKLVKRHFPEACQPMPAGSSQPAAAKGHNG